MRDAFDAASQLVARDLTRSEHVDLGSLFHSGANRVTNLQNPKVAQQVRSYKNTVYKALRFLGNEIAKLDRSVVRVSQETDAEGNRKEVRTKQIDNPISVMLSKGARGQPNPWTTSGNYFAGVEIDLGLTGLHAALKVRNESTGVVESLVRLRPEWIKIIPDEANIGIEGFLVSPTGGVNPIRLARSEVLYIKRPNPLDNRLGWSPLMSLRYAVDTGEQIRRFNWQFFEQGARIDGVIEGAVNTAQMDEVYDMLREGHYRGADTGWLPLVMPAGLKFVPTQATAKDFEFAALAGFTEEDVLEAYNVPQGLLGTVKAVSLANLRGLMTIAAENAVKPELRIIEEHIEADLLNEEEFRGQSGDAYLEYDFDDPTPGDPDQMRKQQESDLKTGVLVINEVRARRGAADVDWGERPWFPLNLQQPGDEELEIEEDDDGPGGQRLIEGTRTNLLDDEDDLGLGAWNPDDAARQIEGGPISLEILDAAIADALGSAADQTLIDRLRPLLINSLTNGAVAIADLLEIDPTIVIGHPTVEQYVAEHLPKLVGINDTTRRAVRDVVAESIEASEPASAQVRILRQRFAQMRGARAIAVARTENGIAWHIGSNEQITETGASRIWISSRDLRVRDSHRPPMDGQCRGPGEPFETTAGIALMHPHDPAAPAGEIISCRCTMAPEVQGCAARSFLLTTEERTAYWRTAIAALLPFERAVRSAIRRIWTEQEQALIEAIEKAA